MVIKHLPTGMNLQAFLDFAIGLAKYLGPESLQISTCCIFFQRFSYFSPILQRSWSQNSESKKSQKML